MMMPGPDYNPERSLRDQLRAARAENDALKLQIDALKSVAESAMAAYRQECYEAGKEPNEPLEGRFQETVRGVVKRIGVCRECCKEVEPPADLCMRCGINNI